MFDQAPIQERHAAIGVFAAIALFAFGALNLLITGGLAPLTPQRAEAEPPAAVTYQVIRSDWAPPAQERATLVAYAVGDANPSDELSALDGDGDQSLASPDTERSYDDISRDIDALYRETSARPDDGHADALYADDTPDEHYFTSTQGPDAKSKAAISADGSASPW